MLSWSGAKGSALGLHELRSPGRYEVVGLLTTVTADHDRVSMHGVRRSLLERQARALALPLATAEIPAAATNDQYTASMGAALRRIRDGGIYTVAFGDLFLEEIRRYREEMLQPLGMKAVFPLWGRDTAALAREFIDLGFGAVLACVDSRDLDGSFVGREYDSRLLDELPPRIDPCGENGEFHTFVFRGPLFSTAIPCSRGEVVLRDERFWYCDLV